ADMELIEVCFVLRELAQLLHAERSPVAAIKNQQSFRAAQVGEMEILAVLIFQGEIGSGVALGEVGLRLRQVHLREQDYGKHAQHAGADQRDSEFPHAESNDS